MLESFRVVDIRCYQGKEKKSYYLVIYSDKGYLFRAYMNEQTYFELLPHKDSLYSDFDVLNNIQKVYNEKEKNFSYFVRLAK